VLEPEHPSAAVLETGMAFQGATLALAVAALMAGCTFLSHMVRIYRCVAATGDGISGPSYLLIGIMMCAPGVPDNINHGRPSPSSAAVRWLPSETPIDSGVAPGTDSTHSS
jgi:hypothetical protein